MATASTPGIEPAIITASASVVVAMVVFVANQVAHVRNQQRRARLERVNDQLRELYGPLHALVAVNEHLWRTMRAAQLPDHETRQAGPQTFEQAEEWQRWLEYALMPANVRMRDLIVEHADLIVEDAVPSPLQDFCAHVASYEVYLRREAGSQQRQALIGHPGAPFVGYVRHRFTTLKNEQARLLRGR